jgi:aquaporin Z
VTARQSLQANWPEYLIEAGALGTFMIAAGVFSTLFEYPGSSVHQTIADASLRRALTGIAMGLTAMALIYSPWGKRSGAHMNPAVTLAFLSVGKMRGLDAVFYGLAQFVGGTLGVVLAQIALGSAFSAAPVSYAQTLPGEAGVVVAFIAELVISAGMMAAVLSASGTTRLAAYTGVIAGCLVALYIYAEAPLSGMSMNPARSFASAALGQHWRYLWLYFTAPLLGMVGAAQLYRHLSTAQRLACAKLQHPADVRCIHCGYQPEPTHGARSHVS